MNGTNNTVMPAATKTTPVAAISLVIGTTLLICMTTGCCSATLYAVGRNSVGFEAKAAGIDKNGNVVVELDRYLGPMGSGTPASYYMERNNAKHRGSRYLVAMQDDINKAIAPAPSRPDDAECTTDADTNQIQSVILSITFTPGTTNSLWQLYPNDIGTHIRSPRLPDFVDAESLEMKPYPLTLQFPLGQKMIEVELRGKRFDKGIHRAWWSKAMQPLYVVTVPVDIVTAPLVIPLALLSFGKNVD